MFDNEELIRKRQETIQLDSLFGNRQLVVVSNRQPYKFEQSSEGVSVNRPVGGLTAGLDPLVRETGGTWIAWGNGDADREVVDDADRVNVPPEDPQYTMRCLWLTNEQVQGYYYGFSNQVLWPLCHSSLATVESESSFWEQYRATNEQFAAATAEEADADSVVWLHDYHLALAPALIREALGEQSLLMQFWHIPWPSWDVFRACPHHEEVLGGLLGNDVLGFHIQRYATNFLECVDAALPEATVDWESGDVIHRGSLTHVDVTPIGVPFQRIQVQAATYRESDFRSFQRSQNVDHGTHIVVGVDRLDYSKGIPERLRALERLWESAPEWRGELTYLQNASESRSEIDAYSDLQETVAEEIRRINGRFGTDDWQPIVRIEEYLDQRELYGLYRHADVGLVSSVRDGLNLVAAEYAAAQVDLDGVLVLSTQTGAHDLVGESAVSVSPYDVDGFAEKLDDALRMSQGERRSRMQHIRRTVAGNDLWTWLRQSAETAQAVERSQHQPGRYNAGAVHHDEF